MPARSTASSLKYMDRLFQEIWQYMTSNDRSQAKFDTYTFADCVAPLFAGLTAATCQIFMGLRCLKLAGNRKWVAVIIGAGILVSLGGAIWLTIANCENWAILGDARI